MRPEGSNQGCSWVWVCVSLCLPVCAYYFSRYLFRGAGVHLDDLTLHFYPSEASCSQS